MNPIGDTKFKTILADPNWSYQNWTDKKNGAAVSHYKLSAVDEICSIPVSDWADKDSYLLLCATLPKLPEAFKVAKAWGFEEYVTAVPWIKVSPNSQQKEPEGFWGPFIKLVRTGIGFWFQATCEILLVFRRGKPKTKERFPVKGLICGNGILFAPVKQHSAKPLSIYDWAMQRLNGPYLELYARNQIFGWTCVGNELGWQLSSEGVTPCDKGEHCGEE